MAFSYPLLETQSGITALIIGIVLVVFVAGLFMGFGELNKMFQNLFGQGLNETDSESATAITSTRALIDAINCVSNPTTCNIPDSGKTYNTVSASALSEAQEKGTSVSCNEEESGLKCTVNNFQLPQSFEGIDSAEEWIAGYGDPRFLIFYRQFPPGEEAAWSSSSEWFSGTGTLVFASMCVSSLLSYAKSPIKTGQRLYADTIESAGIAFRGIRSLPGKLSSRIKEVFYIGDDVIRSASKKELMEKITIYS